MENTIIFAIANAQLLLEKVKENKVEEFSTQFKKEYAEYKISCAIKEMINLKDTFGWSELIYPTVELYLNKDKALKSIISSIPSYEEFMYYRNARKRIFLKFQNDMNNMDFVPSCLIKAQEDRKKEQEILMRLEVLCKIDSGIKLTGSEKLLYVIFYTDNSNNNDKKNK